MDTWTPERCPACRESSSVELDATHRLCLNCRHEWEPASTAGPLAETPLDAPAVVAPALALVPTQARAPELGALLDRARELYVGRQVIVHELEVTGTVDRIDHAGQLTIMFGSGYEIECSVDDVTLVGAVDVPDDVVAAIASTDISVAAQVIRAGAAAISEQGQTRTLTLAPDGWLPDVAEIMPVVEHGASYAIAMLAIQYGVSTDDLLSIAEMLDNAATAAKGAQGQ